MGLGGRNEASPEAVAPVVRLHSAQLTGAAITGCKVPRRAVSQASHVEEGCQHVLRAPVASLQDPSTTHPSAMPMLPLPAIAAGAKAKSAKRPSLARTLSLDRTAGSKLEPGAGMVRPPHQLEPCQHFQGLGLPVHSRFPLSEVLPATTKSGCRHVRCLLPLAQRTRTRYPLLPAPQPSPWMGRDCLEVAAVLNCFIAQLPWCPSHHHLPHADQLCALWAGYSHPKQLCFACRMQISWAQGSGAEHIEKVYARSGTLNGEAVVIFVRALCAVSQEELTPRQPEDPPRWLFVQAECCLMPTYSGLGLPSGCMHQEATGCGLGTGCI